MPQELIVMYNIETGEPVAMHSVDAQEAARIGDYTATPPSGEPANVAQAMARMRSTGGTVHPELQTPEEREETRRVANEQAAIEAASGRPVVVSPAQVGVAAEPAATPARGAGGRFAAERREATPPAATPPADERKA